MSNHLFEEMGKLMRHLRYEGHFFSELYLFTTDESQRDVFSRLSQSKFMLCEVLGGRLGVIAGEKPALEMYRAMPEESGRVGQLLQLSRTAHLSISQKLDAIGIDPDRISIVSDLASALEEAGYNVEGALLRFVALVEQENDALLDSLAELVSA